MIDRIYRNGELVAERHRYDNRLTMAHLTRLDRLAAESERRPEVHAVAAEYDRYLDLLPAGNEGAERFLAVRFPLREDESGPREAGEAWSHGDRTLLRPGSERALLARHTAYAEAGGGLAAKSRSTTSTLPTCWTGPTSRSPAPSMAACLPCSAASIGPKRFQPRMTARMASVSFVSFAASTGSTGRPRTTRDAAASRRPRPTG